jgi:hypothetical protein
MLKYMFSGLYWMSMGRLRQAIDIIPAEVVAPQMCKPSGLKKSIFKENMKHPSPCLSTNKRSSNRPLNDFMNSPSKGFLVEVAEAIPCPSIRLSHASSASCSRFPWESRPDR